MTGKKIDWDALRDGRPQPCDTDPISWKYWAGLSDIKQWEACALSLNINPDNMQHHPQGWMAGPGGGPVFTSNSFPSAAVQHEFDRRLRMLNRIAKGNHAATVNPGEFAALCVHLEFANVPPELLALATAPKPPEDSPHQDIANEQASPSAEEPLPLTTGDIAHCFAGLRWKTADEWKKPLGDKRKWLEPCIAIRGQQGVRETRWNPVCIGAALVRDGHAQPRSVRAKFQTMPLLLPWREAWKSYEDEYLTDG